MRPPPIRDDCFGCGYRGSSGLPSQWLYSGHGGKRRGGWGEWSYLVALSTTSLSLSGVWMGRDSSHLADAEWRRSWL